MKLSGAQILCESLLKEGVEVIFGFPGGSVLPLYDVFPQYPQLRHILVRHEQGKYDLGGHEESEDTASGSKSELGTVMLFERVDHVRTDCRQGGGQAEEENG